MRLIRVGKLGEERPGLQLNNGKRIDVSAFGQDFDEEFFGGDGLQRLGLWSDANLHTAPEFPDDVRYGAPVCRPSKIICIGLNFRDHAEESNMDIPTEPIIFFKSTSALCGPNDDLIIPRNSKKTDWEVELAFVIGKKASYIAVENAMDHVAGYALHNDFSEREFQLEKGGQWVKGKSCDSFAPFGPFLATVDELDDVNNLDMWLNVNGVIKQSGNTSNMVFNVPQIVSYLSQFMSLLPGDIISTGTPAGVGIGFDPPQFLTSGDVVELGIDGLGASSQKAVNYQ
jgi:2,4-diketo-3-deoxy-L-fuconate hydrolase